MIPNSEIRDPSAGELTARLAARLAELRRERGLSLDALADRSGISRATLSRLERGEVSPTTALLAKLCSTYAMTLSRFIGEIEGGLPAMISPDQQPVWRDRSAGFVRRSLSPPAADLAAEVIEVVLDPGCAMHYPAPTRPDHEHHLILRSGTLCVSLQTGDHHLSPGDVLRYRLTGPSGYRAGAEGARYIMVLV